MAKLVGTSLPRRPSSWVQGFGAMSAEAVEGKSDSVAMQRRAQERVRQVRRKSNKVAPGDIICSSSPPLACNTLGMWVYLEDGSCGLDPCADRCHTSGAWTPLGPLDTWRLSRWHKQTQIGKCTRTVR